MPQTILQEHVTRSIYLFILKRFWFTRSYNRNILSSLECKNFHFKRISKVAAIQVQTIFLVFEDLINRASLSPMPADVIAI